MPQRRYSQTTVIHLYGRAAHRCSFPDCRKRLWADATSLDRIANLGKISHIVAHGDNGPRCDPTYPADLRDKYENLILLCGDHHTLVDEQENTFTADLLRQWKADHEAWADHRLEKAMQDIGQAQIEITARALLGGKLKPTENFILVDPGKKMAINGLTDAVRSLLNYGYMQVAEVDAFLQNMEGLSPGFPELLRAGFVQKYDQLMTTGMAGDDLFSSLHEFASLESEDFSQRAAGLTILVYLFEKCEVFEHDSPDQARVD